MGLDLIFPFVKTIAPGSLAASIVSLRPGLVITHIGETSMEYKTVEVAFAEVKRIGRPLRMSFRAVPSPWTEAAKTPPQQEQEQKKEQEQEQEQERGEE